MFRRRKYNILIDTTNGCNLKCTFCSRSNDKITFMKTEDFDTILSKIHKHTISLQLSCAWEYSIDKNAHEIVRILGKYQIHSTTIYTNNNILKDDTAKAIIESRLNDFVVSIGESKKETYERLRKGGNFDRVISNIKKMVHLKKEHRRFLPRICANLTLVNSNIIELNDFVDLANQIGIQAIIGRHLILNEGLDMQNETIKDLQNANDIIDAAEKKATGYGIAFSVPRYEPLNPKQCNAPWDQLYISSDGDVSVCPRIHIYEKVGNLLRDNLADIINGRRMINLRKQFKHTEFSNPVCGICMQNRETVQSINQGF